MYFPYATMLYEHNMVAVALLASFYWLYRTKADGRNAEGRDRSWLWILLSGLCAGCAAITSYLAVVAVVVLGVYLILSVKQRHGWLWFAMGLLGPFVLICVYNFFCFGTPFTTNYRHQNPEFVANTQAFLNVLVWPRFSVLVAVLISPLRGLFFTAPVLLLGVYGIVRLFQHHEFKAEAWLICAIMAGFLLFIASFNGWDGGLAVTSRYLLPAVPFLALPMVFGFVRWRKTACVLAILSAATMFVITAVDPQSPIAVGAGTVPGRPDLAEHPLAASFSYNPMTEYEWPLFLTGAPGPILKSLLDGYLRQCEQLPAAKRCFTRSTPAASRRYAAKARSQHRSRRSRAVRNRQLHRSPFGQSAGRLRGSVLPHFSFAVAAGADELFQCR